MVYKYFSSKNNSNKVNAANAKDNLLNDEFIKTGWYLYQIYVRYRRLHRLFLQGRKIRGGLFLYNLYKFPQYSLLWKSIDIHNSYFKHNLRKRKVRGFYVLEVGRYPSRTWNRFFSKRRFEKKHVRLKYFFNLFHHIDINNLLKKGQDSLIKFKDLFITDRLKSKIRYKIKSFQELLDLEPLRNYRRRFRDRILDKEPRYDMIMRAFRHLRKPRYKVFRRRKIKKIKKLSLGFKSIKPRRYYLKDGGFEAHTFANEQFFWTPILKYFKNLYFLHKKKGPWYFAKRRYWRLREKKYPIRLKLRRRPELFFYKYAKWYMPVREKRRQRFVWVKRKFFFKVAQKRRYAKEKRFNILMRKYALFQNKFKERYFLDLDYKNRFWTDGFLNYCKNWIIFFPKRRNEYLANSKFEFLIKTFYINNKFRNLFKVNNIFSNLINNFKKKNFTKYRYNNKVKRSIFRGIIAYLNNRNWRLKNLAHFKFKYHKQRPILDFFLNKIRYLRRRRTYRCVSRKYGAISAKRLSFKRRYCLSFKTRYIEYYPDKFKHRALRKEKVYYAWLRTLFKRSLFPHAYVWMPVVAVKRNNRTLRRPGTNPRWKITLSNYFEMVRRPHRHKMENQMRFEWVFKKTWRHTFWLIPFPRDCQFTLPGCKYRIKRRKRKNSYPIEKRGHRARLTRMSSKLIHESKVPSFFFWKRTWVNEIKDDIFLLHYFDYLLNLNKLYTIYAPNLLWYDKMYNKGINTETYGTLYNNNSKIVNFWRMLSAGNFTFRQDYTVSLFDSFDYSYILPFLHINDVSLFDLITNIKKQAYHLIGVIRPYSFHKKKRRRFARNFRKFRRLFDLHYVQPLISKLNKPYLDVEGPAFAEVMTKFENEMKFSNKTGKTFDYDLDDALFKYQEELVYYFVPVSYAYSYVYCLFSIFSIGFVIYLRHLYYDKYNPLFVEEYLFLRQNIYWARFCLASVFFSFFFMIFFYVFIYDNAFNLDIFYFSSMYFQKYDFIFFIFMHLFYFFHQYIYI